MRRRTPQTTEQRLDELRAELKAAAEKLDETSVSLAVAVADGEDRLAGQLRADVAALRQRVEELRSALPVAERRIAEARAKEAAAESKKHLAAAMKLRRQKHKAAERVDRALEHLEACWSEYDLAARGEAHALVQAVPHAERTTTAVVKFHLRVRGAMWKLAPTVCKAAAIPRLSAARWATLSSVHVREPETDAATRSA